MCNKSQFVLSKKTWRSICKTGVVGIILFVIVFASERNMAQSQDVESLFSDAISPKLDRLKSAREAAKRGDHEMAIRDYLASIREDPSTAELAIGEMVEIFFSRAAAHDAAGRYVDESKEIKSCLQKLRQLEQVDAINALPQPARQKLSQEINKVVSRGKERANCHVAVADGLKWQAKGKHRWNNDDENKQAEALHKLNLAWGYYPEFSDTYMVGRIYAIWADMKAELPEWQYKQIMERDRLQLGRVVEDNALKAQAQP